MRTSPSPLCLLASALAFATAGVALGACAWALPGCARPPALAASGPPAAPGAPSLEPAASASAAPAPGAEPTPAQPFVYGIRFELRARDHGVRDLALVVDGLGVDEVLAAIPSGHRCALEVSSSSFDGRMLVVCGYGDGQTRALVKWEDDAMSLPGSSTAPRPPRTLSLLPGHKVLVDDSLEDPATAPECQASPRKRTLPVKISLREPKGEQDPGAQGPETQRIVVEVPALGISEEIETHWYEDCRGSVDPKTQAYQLDCILGLHETNFELKAQQDALLIKLRRWSHDGEGERGLSLLGVQHLPCGDRLKFTDFLKRSYDRMCLNRCSESLFKCQARCQNVREQSPEVGERCSKRCDAAHLGCARTCK